MFPEMFLKSTDFFFFLLNVKEKHDFKEMILLAIYFSFLPSVICVTVETCCDDPL